MTYETGLIIWAEFWENVRLTVLLILGIFELGHSNMVWLPDFLIY